MGFFRRMKASDDRPSTSATTSTCSSAPTTTTVTARGGARGGATNTLNATQLDTFLQRRPSAADLVEKGIIPRSVIDAGQATWQVPDRKCSSSGVVAKRTRASHKRAQTVQLRQSLKLVKKPRDPVSVLEERMAPQKKDNNKAPASSKGKGGRGRPAVNESPAGRQAVGPFNLEKLKARFLPNSGGRALRTIPESEGRAVPPRGPFNTSNELVAINNHQQKMKQLKKSYIAQRSQELNQKHNARKKRFTPDTPQHVKFLHSKFRQVFQPFQKNTDKYAERNQTKTSRQSKHINKNVQIKD
mmetsp:Transcript_881/g.1952  ORF Transcript_881/g.1952 Transcript_881/m.1952 type:complete len:300 (-) Transcript_881:122-1021(-)